MDPEVLRLRHLSIDWADTTSHSMYHVATRLQGLIEYLEWAMTCQRRQDIVDQFSQFRHQRLHEPLKAVDLQPPCGFCEAAARRMKSAT